MRINKRQSFREASPDDDAPQSIEIALNLTHDLIVASTAMVPTWRGEVAAPDGPDTERCVAIATEAAAMPKRSLRDARALLMFACRKALEELERCEP